MRSFRTVLALVVGSASCLVIGCAGASSASDEGRAAAASFLDEIRGGRVEPAWRATTVEFKSLMGLDSLRDYVRAHPALKGQAEFVEVRPEGSSRSGLGEYTFRATPPPSTKGRGRGKAGVAAPPAPSTIRVTTASEEGAVKVERLALE